MRFAAIDLAPIRTAWRALRALGSEIDALEADQETRRKEADFLTHALENWASLTRSRARMSPWIPVAAACRRPSGSGAMSTPCPRLA